MTVDEQFAELMARPDVEEAKQLLDGMQAAIRVELSERLGLPEWSENPATGRERSCGDFPDVHPFDVATFSRPLWSTDGPLTAEQWSAATEILRRIGGEYGFTTVDLDSRGEQASTFDLSDGKGAGLHLMVNPQSRVVLQVDAGCHLKTESKRRGRPINDAEKEAYRERVHSPPAPAAPPAPTEPPPPAPAPTPRPVAKPRPDDDEEDFDTIDFLSD